MTRAERKRSRRLLTAAAEDFKGCSFITGEVLIAAAAGEGKRPTFEIKAYSGDPMQTEFSFWPVILDLSGGKVEREDLPILWAHDAKAPVGQADSVTINASGVSLKGKITGDDQEANRIVSHAKNGFKWQASIGASVERREFLEAAKTMTVNGRTVTGPLMIARAWTLKETSFVTIGADSKSTARVAATAKGTEHMNPFQTWLKAKGIESFDTLTAGVRSALQAAFDAEEAIKAGAATPPTPKTTIEAAGGVTPLNVAALVAAAVLQATTEMNAEHQRVASVTTLTASHPEIRAKAIAEKWTAMQTELEVLKASRPSGPIGIVRGASDGPVNGDVMAAAICQAGGMSTATLERAYKAEVLEAAHTRYRGRAGLQQLLLEAAWNNGHTGMHFDKSSTGIGQILKAAFSTLSLPGIFSNVANKFLLAGFMAVESSWRSIAAVRPVTDFKRTTSYRLTGDMEFEEVAGDGELKHGSVGEEDFGNQARTYGKMFVISRKDIINDDLGALTTIPQMIGRGGALKFNSVFWAEWLDDAAFFTTGNGNLISGATSNVGSAGMKAMLISFRRQTDPDGKPLALNPAGILVPPEQEVAALELNRSVTVNTGGAATATQVPNANVWNGRYPPSTSVYLTDADAWYTFANPAELAAIEAVFLNGQQQPTVESAEADFNTLGVQFRGYFDFGVEKQDPRAAIKSTGVV